MLAEGADVPAGNRPGQAVGKPNLGDIVYGAWGISLLSLKAKSA